MTVLIGLVVVAMLGFEEWMLRGRKLPQRAGAHDSKEDEWKPALAKIERDRAMEELAAKLGHGTWVKDKDMNPHCNIANRLYRTPAGHVHRFHGWPMPRGHEADAWFFPSFDAMNQRAMH